MSAASVDDWIQDVRDHFSVNAPDLLALFDVYAAEARFGRTYIDPDLRHLGKGARVLEVGAGSMLLSCQLVREGYAVRALEPVGAGFSHFDRMRELVLARADALQCRPQVINLAAEVLDQSGCYDYAFSVNVMEHVNDVGRVVERVGASLASGASYRFTCANYLFPYEPHFNMPTLFSKKLTETVFGRRIRESRVMSDPVGTWQSLNWITVMQVRQVASRLPWLAVEFNRHLLVSMFERVATDAQFASRRSPLMRGLVLALVRSRLHRLLRFVPTLVQPVMDCRFTRLVDRPLS